jgi:hypothetical protein
MKAQLPMKQMDQCLRSGIKLTVQTACAKKHLHSRCFLFAITLLPAACLAASSDETSCEHPYSDAKRPY